MIPDPRQIRAFLAVVRQGGFTRAAQELNISQPALTVQVRKLEESLGVRLLDRDKRQVRLTQAGKSLHAPLERVLLDIEAVVSTSRDLSTHRRGRVTLAVLPSIAASLLPATLRRFHKSYPGIEVRIYDVVAERIVQMVKSEEVEFGLGSRLTPDRTLLFTEFLTDRMAAFFPTGHPLAARQSIELHDVAAYPLILTGSNSSARVVFERLLARTGTEIHLAAEANYMSTALGMVRGGLGVAILPASAAEAGSMENLSSKRIQTTGLSRRIGLIRRAGTGLSPAAERFVEILCQTADSQPLPYYTVTSRNPL